MSRANIRDVAARAGVAVKTVSRVLNAHPYVSAELRARVEQAMADLDYRPSVAARILSGAKSNQIALIYDNHSPYYMFQIQKGCWEVCQQNGIRLLAQPVDVADPRVGDQVRGLVSETHVDGIILSSPVTDCDPVLRALEAMDVPFIRISPGTNHSLTSSVFMDDAQAADDMTTHLINAGHRRIGFIKGHSNHMASDDRLFGYRRALDRGGFRSSRNWWWTANSTLIPASAAGAPCSISPTARPRSSPRTTTWPPACSPWRMIGASMFRPSFRSPGSTIPRWRARSGRR